MAESKSAHDAYVEFGRQWKQFDEVYRKAAARMGLSESAFDILFALCDLGEGCLQRDICLYSCSTKQTINSSVHKMEKDGLLRLEPAESGRGMRLYLTDAGRSLVDEKVRPFAEADYKVFASFSVADRDALIRIQRNYIDGIEQAFGVLCESITVNNGEGGN